MIATVAQSALAYMSVLGWKHCVLMVVYFIIIGRLVYFTQ